MRPRSPLLPLLGVITSPLLSHVNAFRGFDGCPRPCSVSGFNPSNWTVYSHLSRLDACDKAVMLDFSIYAPVDEAQRVRSCAVWGSDFENAAAAAETNNDHAQINTTTESVNLELAWWNGGDSSSSARRSDVIDVIAAMAEVQSYLTHARELNNNRTILFAASGNAAVGIYVGAAVTNTGVPSAVVQPLIDRIRTSGISKGGALAQVCGTDRTNQDTVGIIATVDGGFASVQSALRAWISGAMCVDGADGSMQIPNTTISTAADPLVAPLPIVSNSTTHSNKTYEPGQRHRGSKLHKRADCRTLTVVSDDSCSKLATKCGITLDQFETYNPGKDFCQSLQPQQRVCCSSGPFPVPKQGSDGSCASHLTIAGDTCGVLALSNGITVADIEKFNKDTWGWNSCDPSKFLAGMTMCLSSGSPPMPAPIEGADCGPQVPNTKRPAAGTSLAGLNPCPLNVCCDIWGHCGTTDEFCDAKPNKCISNCGKDIIKGSAPSSRMSVTYFEGFNLQRDCLNMDISQVDTKAYTHIHFAFAVITSDFKVSLGSNEALYEFNQFRNVGGVKKILSFGGWDFSTNPSTYMIFRQGTNAANRQQLATNMANFIKDNGMDGIDIDWEYPSAPDIPGIPAGDKAEGNNLLEFLKLLKTQLPGKSVSIAAPASYWYLKGIPIMEISKVVDYIVYMTYDLHGQWDYGNMWSDPGCPGGNCLRSDVNMTETLNALVMITKAGVPANKVVVGLTSYGRSFKMTSPGCTAESCTYTGSVSGATPGRCTQQAGYIGDAEIQEILKTNSKAKTFFDSKSQTDILVYNDTQWASYMTKGTKDTRIQLYNTYNFLGSSDWAIDLEDFHEPPGTSNPEPGSFSLKLTWDMFKANIKSSGIATCNESFRTGTWVSIPCTVPETTNNLRYSPQERWKALDCDSAWSDALTRWFGCDAPAQNGTFSQSVANFLHVQPLTSCDDLSLFTNCDMTVGCEAHNTEYDDITAKTGACAYEIWNSMVVVHEMVKNFQATSELARTRVMERKDDFIKDFASSASGDLAPLFNILNPVLGMVGGWFFKGSLAGKPAYKNSSDFLESATMNALSIFLGFVPSLLSKPEDLGKVAWDDCITRTFNAWNLAAQQFISIVFSGSADGVKDLTSIIANGAMIDGSSGGTSNIPTRNVTESFIAEGFAERAFFGVSIPTIWNDTGLTPVVLMTDYDCGTQNPLSPTYLDDYVGPETWVCLPDQNKMYYLVGAEGDQDNCEQVTNGGPNTCHNHTFRKLHGTDKLDGKTWGNLTRDDIVVGAVNTFIANKGNKAGGLNLQDKATLKSVVQSDIRAAGMINIPVCTAKEAYTNWTKGKKESKAKFYPCN